MDEPWPRRFISPDQAIRFADSYLDQPNLLSQAGVLLRDSIQRTSPPAVDKHGGRITRERLDDLAGTITGCLMQCDAPEAWAYRYVFGRCKNTEELAEILASRAWDGPGGNRTIIQMRDLATMVLTDYRQAKQGRSRFYYKQMARGLGVSRNVFYQVWRPYVETMRETIAIWLRMADNQFDGELRERNIL
jgi:hypothetical protein